MRQPTRNAELGTRNRGRRAPFRVPRSAFRVSILLAACNPATTRPPFSPYPEALTAVVDVRPDRLTTEVRQWLAAEGVPIEWVSVQDGYAETSWYDPGARQAFEDPTASAALATAVKIRCWADPDVPGRARLTVEAVYRPVYDPSRIPRDLERPVPRDHAGYVLAQRLLDAVRDKFPVR